MKKKKVIVAMSGGVDSSVAALLMKKKGYEVIGVFLKCWSDTKNSIGECAWKTERRFAMKICHKLKIPLVTIDAEKEYKKYVIGEMFKDYKKGITPNPDILCNEIVKFPFLLKTAKKFKADAIVTGHFAKVKKSKKKYFLYRAKDEMKDQSYFLYRLKEKDLANLIFPIGEYTKKEVREIAKINEFPNYGKKSTVGICFIGKVNLKDFLKKKIKSKKGKILGPDEKTILGEHDGVYYYTIGQRLGSRFDLNIKKVGKANMQRWYVAKKDIKKNTITVAPKGHEILYKKHIIIKDFHLISENINKFKKGSHKVYSRIRHVGELVPSTLDYNKKTKKFELNLGIKLDGVSSGQAVVLYQGRKVLGGGVIYE